MFRKITEGKYEDKEEPHRSFDGHAFGVYMVRCQINSTQEFFVSLWKMSVKTTFSVYNNLFHIIAPQGETSV